VIVGDTYRRKAVLKFGLLQMTIDCVPNTCRWFLTENTAEKWAAEVCAGLIDKGQGKLGKVIYMNQLDATMIY